MKKKGKVTKKIGQKHSKKSLKKRTQERQRDMNNLNTEISYDLDTMVNSTSEGADTLETSVEKKTDVRKKKKTTVWMKPKRNPTNMEQRKPFGKALEMMLILCMDNHV